MAQKIRFTKRAIEALPVPADRTEYQDEKQSHLRLRVSPSGRRTFFWYGRQGSTCKRVTIGSFPDMSVEIARKAAQRFTVARDEGKDVKSRRARPTRSGTLQEAFDNWWEAKGSTMRTAKEERRKWEKYLKKPLGERQADHIRKSDVAAVHRQIGREYGNVQANRCLRTLSSIYRFGDFEHNPVTNVERFKEASRERYVQSGDEMVRFFEVLNNWPQEWFRMLIRLCLYTGQRKSTILSMRWDEVDLDTGIWFIAADKNANKAQRDLELPLAQPAVEVLQKAPRYSEWVFPSFRSQTGHRTSPGKEWDKFREAAGITDVTLHDIRRTLGSWQHNIGKDQLQIARSLGQTSTTATMRYTQTDAAVIRRNVAEAIQAMQDERSGDQCSKTK